MYINWRQLDENILILMCNVEKKISLSFFDVMEHLLVHLPYETLLREPVHNGWIYPYERFTKHLKGKAKNLARVDGSIFAGSLNEETYHFMSYYIGSQVRTRRRLQADWWWCYYADICCWRCSRHILSVGRLGGKLKEVWWSNTEDARSARTYILLSCEEIQSFER